MRHLNLSDYCISAADNLLKTLTTTPQAKRPLPGEEVTDGVLSTEEKRHSARLMRVNHAGEIAAQGLYHGQAISARNPKMTQQMQHNAHEESDHLAWCEQRINELDNRVSVLSPVWYFGALSIGILAGIAGDRWSLGFVKETEEQVVRHLQSHLDQLSPNDKKTAAIIQQIAADELEHAQTAQAAGSHELPLCIKQGMRLSAKVMTTTAYYL